MPEISSSDLQRLRSLLQSIVADASDVERASNDEDMVRRGADDIEDNATKALEILRRVGR